MSSKSKARLPRDPLTSKRIAFLRPVAKRVASKLASAPPVNRPMKSAASSTVTWPRPLADLGGQAVHGTRQRALLDEGLGDAR